MIEYRPYDKNIYFQSENLCEKNGIKGELNDNFLVAIFSGFFYNRVKIYISRRTSGGAKNSRTKE